MDDFWVFGYGSLMWNPGFEVIKREQATVFGLHRALCIYSWVYRGTPKKPGLVLGLDHGGSCRGVALKAPGKMREEIISYLRAREQVTAVYLESWRKVELDGGKRVDALIYRVDQNHEQYAARLSIDKQVEIVNSSHGKSGPNTDYVISTVDHLRECGIHDHQLEQVRAGIKS